MFFFLLHIFWTQTCPGLSKGGGGGGAWPYVFLLKEVHSETEELKADVGQTDLDKHFHHSSSSEEKYITVTIMCHNLAFKVFSLSNYFMGVNPA